MLKRDSELASKYQFGKVFNVFVGKDGFVRKAKVTFRNHNEKVNRETFRSTRELVVIHSIDDLDINEDLRNFSKIATDKMKDSI